MSTDVRPTKPPAKSPVNSKRPNVLTRWINQQHHAILFSLERLWFNPISTWITLAAIAIALSLPTSLNVLVNNLQTLTDSKREVPTITIFLKSLVTEQQAKDQAELFSEWPEITAVRVVTRDEAIGDFKQITGFAETLKTLGENPLPHVIIATPNLNVLGETEMDLKTFSDRLKAYRNVVDSVQIDVEWIQRLRAILRIVDRIVLVVSVLLGLTVLLVIGNTIRLDIENRKEEIRVTRLIGATNGYIRRPFLYNGIWLGLFGGILSLLIVHLALLFLTEPVDRLASLYGNNFSLTGISPILSLEILGLSAILGLLGAWLAVGRYLWQQELNE